MNLIDKRLKEVTTQGAEKEFALGWVTGVIERILDTIRDAAREDSKFGHEAGRSLRQIQKAAEQRLSEVKDESERSYDREKETEKLARAVSDWVNNMCYDPKPFIKFWLWEHRYLQAKFIQEIIIPLVAAFAKNHRDRLFDARNEYALNLCRIMRQGLRNANYVFLREDEKSVEEDWD